MADQPRADRLLRLLLLLSGNHRLTLREIAERIETTERTVYRYIETLRDQGFIVYREGKSFTIDRGAQGWKQIADLLHFTREESWILNRAIMALDDEVAIKQNLAGKLYSIYNLKGIPYPVIRRNQSEKVCCLIRAIENRETVLLHDYQSPNSDTVSDRLVEPFEFTLNYGFVWCFEHESQRNKLFKTARIRSVIPTGHSWTHVALHRSEPTDMFRISGSKSVIVALRLSLRAASLLMEEYPESEDCITGEPCKGYRFCGPVNSFEGIGRFVLGLPDEIEVEEPQEFRDFLNRKIKDKIF